MQETFAQSNKTQTLSAWKNKRALKHPEIIFHGTKKKESADRTAGSSFGFEKNTPKETRSLFSPGSWVEAHSGHSTSSLSLLTLHSEKEPVSLVVLDVHAVFGAKGQEPSGIVLHLPSLSCLSLPDLASEEAFSGLLISVLGYFTSKQADLLLTLGSHSPPSSHTLLKRMRADNPNLTNH